MFSILIALMSFKPLLTVAEKNIEKSSCAKIMAWILIRIADAAEKKYLNKAVLNSGMGFDTSSY